MNPVPATSECNKVKVEPNPGVLRSVRVPAKKLRQAAGQRQAETSALGAVLQRIGDLRELLKYQLLVFDRDADARCLKPQGDIAAFRCRKPRIPELRRVR